jgi:hypothetical protein
MVVSLNHIFFRPDQATNVGKKFVEWMKDHPPDKTLYKNLCILIKSTEGGDIEALGIDEVMKGKVEELLKLYSAMNLFLASGVDGLKYKTEICLNFSEAYKIINLAPPQV